MKLFYHKTDETYYECDELVFDVGEAVEYIYFVMEGVFAIELCDGFQSHQLDLLGRGSLVQLHTVIFNEVTNYRLRCVWSQTSKVRKI